MVLSKFIDSSLPLIALFITACSSNNTNLQDTGLPLGLSANDIVLPIEVGRYTTWQCKDNTTIQTQFSDDSKAILQVKYQDKQYTLFHKASRLPIIYEDKNIAFYSDGESAVIGKPMSDQVFHGGCNPIDSE